MFLYYISEWILIRDALILIRIGLLARIKYRTEYEESRILQNNEMKPRLKQGMKRYSVFWLIFSQRTMYMFSGITTITAV